MKDSDLVLGLDTSNYTTSVALTDQNEQVCFDFRTPLAVIRGERGLRQSNALFQHLENLPLLIEQAMAADGVRERIRAVAFSSRPRPVEGSYMPVFLAGMQFGKTAAASLGVPYYAFSHQEGHVAAAAHGTHLCRESEFLAYHLSGGTCELLLVSHGAVQILGGSRDLSFGQVLDRLGVAMGLDFPAGSELDRLALAWPNQMEQEAGKGEFELARIPISGLEINLSGIETQAQRLFQKSPEEKERLAFAVFSRIVECLSRWTAAARAQTKIRQVLFCGGVSSSLFVRNYLTEELRRKGMEPIFGTPKLSSDNAAGIALLGGRSLWR